MTTPFKPLPTEEVRSVYNRLALAAKREGLDDSIWFGVSEPLDRRTTTGNTCATAVIQSLKQVEPARARVARHATMASEPSVDRRYQGLDDTMRDRALHDLKLGARYLASAAQLLQTYGKNLERDVGSLPILPPTPLLIGNAASILARGARNLVRKAQTNGFDYEPVSL